MNLLVRAVGVVALAGLSVWFLALYPLPPWPLAVTLLAYAACLWHWPAAFLLVLPIVLPGYDLGIWTGWLVLGEADPFVLVTVAVLLLRTPPSWRDLLPPGGGGLAVLAFVAMWLIAIAVGLLSPLGAEISSNPYLRPDNALRLAKGPAEALVLLPFMLRRQRLHADVAPLLGIGIAAGLLPVALAVGVERQLFCGLLDFTGDYRATGQFTSMHVGGGYIGAYAALALPFALSLATLRPRVLGVLLAPIALLLGGYTLAASMARTAFGAGGMGLGATVLVGVTARRRDRSAVVAMAAIVVCMAGLASVAAFTGMRARFSTVDADLTTREDDWRAGMAVRDTDPLTTLFGMGLGTYQRAMVARSMVNRPSDIVLREGEETVVEVHNETRFYLGQKVQPSPGVATVHLQARALNRPNTIGVALCDKVMLYSDECRSQSVALPVPGRWQDVTLSLPMDHLGRSMLFDWLRRPVEFSLFENPGWVQLRDLSLTGADGRPMLANADFAQGLDHWLFTDDEHVPWRMKNVYLMLFFETGVLGLAAYLAVAGFAMAGGLAAARAGVSGAAPVVGGVAAFLVSGLFDNVLETPRLAALFFLICICGLIARPETVPAPGSR